MKEWPIRISVNRESNTDAEETMAETIPFKNLHSREYHGRKKTVQSQCWANHTFRNVELHWEKSCIGFCGSNGGKRSQQAELCKENINITYKLDGTHAAVGNQVG
ncbi:hypothetical protein L2E82_43900 [Cichorium intybus]|uniref:Uncharacterized protein n=1 Tax=Cichorium intybus TaxID=13427 RepID=A0ACB8ZPE6_CICIN|nr:hypothetical protein L2E82_43900 [Cichorium intybus]